MARTMQPHFFMKSETVVHIQLVDPVDADMLQRLSALIDRVASHADTCEHCGRRIAFIRLLEQPATRACINCANEEEWRPGP
jgi:RNA polymerase-binding transcription factor DksA